MWSISLSTVFQAKWNKYACQELFLFQCHIPRIAVSLVERRHSDIRDFKCQECGPLCWSAPEDLWTYRRRCVSAGCLNKILICGNRNNEWKRIWSVNPKLDKTRLLHHNTDSSLKYKQWKCEYLSGTTSVCCSKQIIVRSVTSTTATNRASSPYVDRWIARWCDYFSSKYGHFCYLACVTLFRSVLHVATYPATWEFQQRSVTPARYYWLAQIVCFVSFPLFLCFYWGYKVKSSSFFSLFEVRLFLIFLTLFRCWSWVATGCFILKIDQMAYAVPLYDFLSGWTCSVLDCTFIAADVARLNLEVRNSQNSKVAPKP